MPILRSEAEQMVKDCIEREGKMTDWECDFITDLSGRILAGHWLTDPQKEKIGKIWDKVTADG